MLGDRLVLPEPVSEAIHEPQHPPRTAGCKLNLPRCASSRVPLPPLGLMVTVTAATSIIRRGCRTDFIRWSLSSQHLAQGHLVGAWEAGPCFPTRGLGSLSSGSGWERSISQCGDLSNCRKSDRNPPIRRMSLVRMELE